MPLGDGMTSLVQHATKQQDNNTYTKRSARSLSASKHQLDQHKSVERAPSVPQRHRNINTNTAYVEDTNVMVSSHSKGRENGPLLTYLRKSPTPIHATSTKTLSTAQISSHTPSTSSPLTTWKKHQTPPSRHTHRTLSPSLLQLFKPGTALAPPFLTRRISTRRCSRISRRRESRDPSLRRGLL
jgi:hypothetical protein